MVVQRKMILKSGKGVWGGCAAWLHQLDRYATPNHRSRTLQAAERNVVFRIKDTVNLGRTLAPGGIRVGELYFASGATGVAPERRKDPSVPPGDIREQTTRILERQKKNLEGLGSSLENVLKVTVFLADPKNDRPGALGHRRPVPGRCHQGRDRVNRLNSAEVV